MIMILNWGLFAHLRSQNETGNISGSKIVKSVWSQVSTMTEYNIKLFVLLR